MNTYTPRSAAVLFTRALNNIDQIQPDAARAPIRDMLAAGIEQCTISTSLLGKPINHLIALAEALAGAVPEVDGGRHIWTSHGYTCCQHPGPRTGEHPNQRVRCGGPAICGECATQAARAHGANVATPE